ncbi:histidinol-phosphate transaminase [Malassezia equina]|uniref:histidinol-phosphate transaminase n=1 Tax=Malassezia equina TaxID=1381935 RepID=A0AAF0J1Q2_9BASI|nr:histidinol-phosphate transaminase [Malassezia equina]
MGVQGVNAQACALARAHKPEHFVLERVVRPNILALQPYRCARDDFQEGVLLDANENAMGPAMAPGSAYEELDLHRYPDPSLYEARERATKLRGLPHPAYTFLGVGSDEVIDLIQRCFARPGQDKILICPPTYGMYSVSANINDIDVVEVPLITENGAFQLDTPRVQAALRADPAIRVVFLCSPGNPTGTLLPLHDVQQVLDTPDYAGLVVVDEAYIDFAAEKQALKHGAEPVSAVSLVHEYANVIVAQTLSKSFGLAGVRLGLAFAQPPIVQVMNNTKAPYNISSPAAYLASQSLSDDGIARMRANVQALLHQRDRLQQALAKIPAAGAVLGGNDANFVLVQVLDRPGGVPDSQRAKHVYETMARHRGLVVRNRSSELGCAGCLRITIGTAQENDLCIALLTELLA